METVSIQSVETQVRQYFSDIPILVEIAECESRFRQYDHNGDVLHGEENRQDIGVMQINERFHLEDSINLGLDIYSLNGNLAYARHLYEKFGVAPWKYSKKCWGGMVLALSK